MEFDINDKEVSPNSDVFKKKVLKSIFKNKKYTEYEVLTKEFTATITRFFVN